MNRTEYRSHPALNFSAAKHLLRSPAHYRHYLEHPTEPTPEMLIGTQVHRWLEGLEPDILVRPSHNPEDPADAWHGNKKWCRAWTEAHAMHGWVGDEDMLRIHGCIDALAANPLARQLLALAPGREVPLLAEYRGIPIKGLLDAVGTDADGKRFVIDLKTTADASPRGFARAASNQHYNMQAAWYCQLLALTERLEYQPAWLNIVVENDAPYGVAVYGMDEATLEDGQRKMDLAIDRFKECQQSGRYPSYPLEIQTLSLSRYP